MKQNLALMAAGALFVASFSLGCNPAQTSEVKIRNGENVGAEEGGPFLRATVAILSNSGLCTGTVVAEDLILAAGHCEGAIKGGRVVFGNHLQRATAIVDVADYRSNKNWEGNQKIDVALIKLNGTIPSGWYPVPIYEGDLNGGEGVVLAGFGSTGITDGSGVDGQLRKTSAQFKFVDRDALYVEGSGTGVCSGDSGGPLFIFRDNKTYVAGAASTSNVNGNQCIDGSHYASTKFNAGTLKQWAREMTGRDALGGGGGGGGDNGGGGNNNDGGGSGWGQRVQLRAVLNQQCFDVANRSQVANADILSWPCTDHNNQKFRIQYFNSEEFLLVNLHSNLCVDVGGWSQDEGARVNTWNCNQTQGNQVFSFTANANGSVMFRNKHSGKCLTIAGGNADAGTRIVTSGCENRPEQQFWIE